MWGSRTTPARPAASRPSMRPSPAGTSRSRSFRTPTTPTKGPNAGRAWWTSWPDALPAAEIGPNRLLGGRLGVARIAQTEDVVMRSDRPEHGAANRAAFVPAQIERHPGHAARDLRRKLGLELGRAGLRPRVGPLEAAAAHAE